VRQVRKLTDSTLGSKNGATIALVVVALATFGSVIACIKAANALTAAGNYADLTGGNGSDPVGWIAVFGSAILVFIFAMLWLAMILTVLIRWKRLEKWWAGRSGS
jgi:hypothetical protein